MKRSALKRKTPLRSRHELTRGQPLGRKVAMRKKNPKRRERAFRRAYGSEAFAEFVRLSGCVVPGCVEWPAEVAHVRSRGAGGTWKDTVGLCRAHHREQHMLGVRTWQRKYGLDLAALAKETQAAWAEFNAREGAP